MNASEPSQPELSEETVAAHWRQASRRVLKRERRRTAVRRGVAGAVALASVTVALLVMRRDEHPQEGTWLPVTTVALADESRVSLHDGARLLLAADRAEVVSLNLEQGRASFDVTKRRGRRFTVSAGDVEVWVVGTRFSVNRDHQQVTVTVDEGTVEVRHGGERAQVNAGESWQRLATVSAQAPSRAVDPEPSPADPEPSPLEASPLPDVHDTPPPEAASPHPSRAPKKRAAPRAGASTPANPSEADALFTAALEARRAGRTTAAVVAWQAFLAAAPNDARAPLANFELGRLEMDVLHERAAATVALQHALRASPNATFAEDALARLVELASMGGDPAACRQLKAEYQRRFSQGVHAGTVAARCQ